MSVDSETFLACRTFYTSSGIYIHHDIITGFFTVAVMLPHDSKSCSMKVVDSLVIGYWPLFAVSRGRRSFQEDRVSVFNFLLARLVAPAGLSRRLLLLIPVTIDSRHLSRSAGGPAKQHQQLHNNYTLLRPTAASPPASDKQLAFNLRFPSVRHHTINALCCPLQPWPCNKPDSSIEAHTHAHTHRSKTFGTIHKRVPRNSAKN